MKTLFMIGILIISATKDNIARGPYEPTVQSLSAYEAPEWFRDAKFGIYTHWGPVAVATAKMPAGQSDCWYGRYMYCPGLSGPLPPGGIPGRSTFEFHRKTFGDQSEFGFKDIIPLFKAERFNADEWADLFARSGARFAGAVVIHHDNFAMWDSDVTRWNAADMGPMRDLTGELEKAIHARGMKFVAAMHHAMTWFFYEQAYKYDGRDPQYADLYCEPHAEASPDLTKDWCQVEWTPVSERFVREWLDKCIEIVDKYNIDLLWHDAAMDKLPEQARLEMAAHFYNRSWERGIEPVLTYKGQDLPAGIATLDFERHAATEVLAAPWLTDTSVGRNFWYYDAGDADSFTIAELVRMLVEIVSKNGCLLLNVGPHPDGTISQKQKDTLLGIGQWLDVNSEAIYDTRPWKVFGEGPNMEGGGSDTAAHDAYSQQDIRFTARVGALYAITLAAPKDEVRVTSLGAAAGYANADVRSVQMVGSGAELQWRQEDDALVIEIPVDLPCDHAVAFRIALE